MIELLAPLSRGFLLGLGLIVAIGAQNAFILERGLLREHVFVLCLICAASDAVLIAAGVAGLGTVIAANPGLIRIVTVGGAIFLYAYALMALRRLFSRNAMSVRGGRSLSLGAASATVLGLTFLNPHVYLDTVVLLGGLSARYEVAAERLAYAGGAMAASLLWFFALGYGARLLAPLFARPTAWRVLDALIAAVMAALATSLLLGGSQRSLAAGEGNVRGVAGLFDAPALAASFAGSGDGGHTDPAIIAREIDVLLTLGSGSEFGGAAGHGVAPDVVLWEH